jgi:hypothetical protein
LNFTAPALLSEAHDASAFDSGEAVLDDWLCKRALQNLYSLASRTYVVCPEGETRIAGFFALAMGQILAQEASGAMRRNMPRNIHAVVQGRLAIDRTFQGEASPARCSPMRRRVRSKRARKSPPGFLLCTPSRPRPRHFTRTMASRGFLSNRRRSCSTC